MDGALVASSSSSSTAPTAGRWAYDVFLSFRGEDTRNNFVDHLNAALDRAGIYTFKDDEKLPRGKSISPELKKAIEGSMASVVVFSKNYANSSWCLEELVKIIECRDNMGQTVLPVFYDVDPSDVRGQKGSFQTAFQQHEVKLIDDFDKVKRWREALKTAANLSGWDVPRIANGREADCIKQIVRTILSYTKFRPQENLIGMELRVRHVKALLCKAANDACFTGIWGMGGIGKTTIARAVYHQLSYAFEGSSFLEDVRENGSDKRGLKSLQEKLLSDTLMQDQFKVNDCHDGMCQIRRRLSRKRVLVVLDNVDNIKQLQFLAGACDWFGPGSRIIITTRDKHLLCDAQEKYTPELLGEMEAMRLFSKYAFKTNTPPKEFEEVSRDVVRHTGHLPLALKVLGSHFRSRNLEFWKSELKVLTKIPHDEVNGNLKLSYDGLNILQKNIFLLIACFFKGKGRHLVTRILDAVGFEAVSCITVLIEKSLLSISEGDLHMHDLIQEMGQCTARECYPNMVWDPEEIKEVMTTINRLEAVEAMVVRANSYRGISYSAELLKSMKKLRLLEVKGGFTSSEPTYYPEQLRWLSWLQYPFDSLRITRDMINLVGLNMTNGKMRQLHIENMVILPNLKFVDLQYSQITMFPSVSGLPNLEWLNLFHCSSLVKIHRSVFLHGKIAYFNLSFCTSLEILSFRIKMKSLHTLLLNDCELLKRFPEVSTGMERLSVLHIHCCNRVRTLPPSIRLLTGLTSLFTGGSVGFVTEKEALIQGFVHLSSLRVLDLSENLLDDSFPIYLRIAWPFLEEFLLFGNNFTRLPATISQLSRLKYLDLSYCSLLKDLPVLPSLIQVLKAKGCRSLEKIGDLSKTCKWLFKISVRGCPKLLLDRESQSHIANLLMKSLVQKCAAVNHRLGIMVPGSEIPNWFRNQRLGNKVPLHLPQNQISKMIGLAICCCLPPNGRILTIKFNRTDEKKLISSPAYPAKSADCIWIGYMSIDILGKLCHSFESERFIISFELHSSYIIECGMCAIYKDDIKPTTGIGSWILDFDELGKTDRYRDSTAGEELQHGRWPIAPNPLFHRITSDQNSFRVFV